MNIARSAILGATSVALLACLSAPAAAHHRDFTFLRDWYLPYAGENEVELRVQHNNRMNEFIHEVEFEHGVTNHFAIEPGLSWHQQDAEKFHIDGFDLELRFNFLDFKENTVLPALNVEYEHPFDSAEPDRGEVKFVFSYYTPKGEDLSVNLNVGTTLNKGAHEKESEIQFGYMRPLQSLEKTKGHGYKVGLRGGFEARFDFQEHFLNIGPTIGWEKDEHFNILAHYFFGPNKRHENTDGFRVIAEWEF